MRPRPTRKVKTHKSYGRYINQLSGGKDIVLIEDVPSALNLTKFIKNNVGAQNLVIEPLRHNMWGLTWRKKAPKLTLETPKYMFFDFGDVSDYI